MSAPSPLTTTRSSIALPTERAVQGRVVVAVEGGLCNRLRVLLSVLHLKAQIAQPVRIAWAKNKECGAAFDELFAPIIAPDFSIAPRAWTETPISRRNLHLPALWRRLSFDAQVANCLPAAHGSLVDLARRFPRLYLSTCYAQSPYPPALTDCLHPQPALQRRIDALVSQFHRPTIGVHIRRTDNRESIAHSPTEAFCHAMDAHPDAQFFLSSDDEGVKTALRRRYGDRLLVQPTAVRRDTLAGMEEAVVDLFTLARTDRLLGSYWSSFTDTAAEMGGMPLDIVHS